MLPIQRWHWSRPCRETTAPHHVKLNDAGFLAHAAKVCISSRKKDVCDATAARLMQQYGSECISMPANLAQLERITAFAAKHECPPPVPTPNIRGRVKRSKARHLLERLVNYEADVLRFMTEEHVPFTHNQGENDLCMTKVQQKMSGCFRWMDGAKKLCRIRSYLSTCRKQGSTASKALSCLFDGKDPEKLQQKNMPWSVSVA